MRFPDDLAKVDFLCIFYFGAYFVVGGNSLTSKMLILNKTDIARYYGNK